MTAPQFQEQLFRSLNLRLSRDEVLAVMNYFDNNSDGYKKRTTLVERKKDRKISLCG